MVKYSILNILNALSQWWYGSVLATKPKDPSLVTHLVGEN